MNMEYMNMKYTQVRNLTKLGESRLLTLFPKHMILETINYHVRK
jgi:hypothetical protein